MAKQAMIRGYLAALTILVGVGGGCGGCLAFSANGFVAGGFIFFVVFLGGNIWLASVLVGGTTPHMNEIRWSRRHLLSIGGLIALWFVLHLGCDVMRPPYKIYSGEGMVLLPINEPAYDEYRQSHAKHDVAGENHLLLAGWAWVVKDGDMVRVVERQGERAKVKVDDSNSGADGHQGWLPSEWIIPRKSKPPQASSNVPQGEQDVTAVIYNVYKVSNRFPKLDSTWEDVRVSLKVPGKLVMFTDRNGVEHMVVADGDTFTVEAIPR